MTKAKTNVVESDENSYGGEIAIDREWSDELLDSNSEASILLRELIMALVSVYSNDQHLRFIMNVHSSGTVLVHN